MDAPSLEWAPLTSKMAVDGEGADPSGTVLGALSGATTGSGRSWHRGFHSLEGTEGSEEAPRELLHRAISAMMSGEEEQKKASFLERAHALSLPGNPLDEVLRRTRALADQEAHSSIVVVELTGRKGVDSSTRVRDIDRFQRGEARVAVISGAASAGISPSPCFLHLVSAKMNIFERKENYKNICF